MKFSNKNLNLVADHVFAYSPSLGNDRTKNAENRISVSELDRIARYQLMDEENMKRWVNIRMEVMFAQRPNMIIGRVMRPSSSLSSYA